MRSTRRALGVVIAAVMLTVAAPVAQADEYESDRSGHPVRILAYLVHPIGVALDYLIMRPAHWVGHQESRRVACGQRGASFFHPRVGTRACGEGWAAV